MSEIAELRAERDHWKANHDAQVAIKRKLQLLYRDERAHSARLAEALTIAWRKLRGDWATFPGDEQIETALAEHERSRQPAEERIRAAREPQSDERRAV